MATLVANELYFFNEKFIFVNYKPTFYIRYIA